MHGVVQVSSDISQESGRLYTLGEYTGVGGDGGGNIGGAGGGDGGFGLQILLSAIGTQLDNLALSVIKAGQALKDPIANFDQLNDRLQLFSKEAALGVKNLIELGRAQEAANEIQRRLIDTIGSQGYDDLVDLGDTTKQLSKDWEELTIKMQALMAGPLGALLRALNKGISGTGDLTNNTLKGAQMLGRLSDKEKQKFLNETNKAALQDLKPPVGRFFPGTGTENADKVIEKYLKQSPEPAAVQVELTPEQKHGAADIALANAEKEFALVEQGVALERKVTDFRRNTAKQVFDFQQKAAALERSASDFRRSIEDRL